MATKKKPAKTFKKAPKTANKATTQPSIAETPNQRLVMLAAIFIILTILLIILA